MFKTQPEEKEARICTMGTTFRHTQQKRVRVAEPESSKNLSHTRISMARFHHSIRGGAWKSYTAKFFFLTDAFIIFGTAQLLEM